ncbi:MAG: hypothetical protein QM477_00965, partial [Planctomycetota bacterium]
MRLLLPLLLLGGLLAAIFFIYTGSSTAEEAGSDASPETGITAADLPDIAPAGSLEIANEAESGLQRSSEDHAALVLSVLDPNGEPASDFKLFFVKTDGEVLVMEGENGSLALANISGLDAVFGFGNHYWSEYVSLEKSGDATFETPL